MKCLMLQIRGGVERDSHGKKAGKGALITEGRAPTLGVSQDATLFQMGGGTTAMSYDGYNQRDHEEVTQSLRGIGNSEGDDCTVKVAIKQSFGINPQGGQMLPFDKECGETLAIGHQGGVMTEQDISQMKYLVRRLTPVECERLMGLPDGWTIPKNLEVTDALVEEFREKHDTFKRIMAEYENEPMPKPTSAAQVRKWLEKIANPDTCPDAPRYKACGNGWATNQPRWILTRLLTTEGVEW